MRHSRILRPAILALFALLAAASLFAAGYTIYLKDGSRIVAKQKYKIENGRAIIIQLNGTQTFVPASQIDVKRTEQANKEGYGGAVVLPGTPQDIGTAPTEVKKDKTLADLIKTKEAAPRELPGNRREKTAVSPGGIAKTKAGFLDLGTLARKPYPHADITAEMQQFFHGQGTEELEIYEGTRADHPLLEITTNSEGSVFKTLTTAANALLHIREVFPNRVAAFELLMTTPERERAGQFVLTPEMAADLVSKKVDVTAFFIRNVQF
ncbi:MAG TPA: hypothetical protein VGX68_09955 [Thermoanaerobaculia bacterium]|jgi:hypothetical protein|nr:hypothetical protein [Thermoanaerobaculia bacterium]